MAGHGAEEAVFHRWIGADLELRVHAVPGAKRTEAQGLHGPALKVKVQARAVEGAANAALIEFLAGELQVPRRQCVLVSGEKNRDKRVLVQAPPRTRTMTLENFVAAYPEHGTTGEALVQAADAALYRAKNAGRDRVVVSA